MGVEYSLLKVGKGKAYLLGRPAQRAPVADWHERMGNPALRGDVMAQLAIFDPSRHAMWSIGSDDGACEVQRLDQRFDVASLASLVEKALLAHDDHETALAIAADVLEWAGGDRVVLLPDNLDRALMALKLGVTLKRPTCVRRIGDVARTLAA